MKRVSTVIRGVRPHWVGDGFPVRSVFGHANFTTQISPFLMLDYAEPYEFPAGGNAEGDPRGVGEHPHRGFETVTIVYQGELEHRDSAGNRGRIGPGDVQWMTAASGVVHEEYHSADFMRRGGPFEVAQLWINLPAKDKMSHPRYQAISGDDIPTVTLADGAGAARVIAGELQGVRGPAKTFTPVSVWDLALPAGKTVELPAPDGHTAALLVQQAAVVVDGEAVQAGETALLDRAGSRVELIAQGDARALFLAGEPIDEPVVAQGPFVMNSREEILQAIVDYQSGKMGSFE
jgi:redox-sensitive bicupin YhaK (pirin superfamily)